MSESPIPYRYERLTYAAINVTDLAASTRFYRDLVGLMVTEETDEYTALRCSRDHHNLMLYKAAEPGLKRIAFKLESAADLKAAREHIESLGVATEEVAAEELQQLCIGQAFRFRVPECNVCLEFFVQMMHMASDFKPTVAQIERIGHVVVNVEDFDPVLEFLTDKLGFQVSDYVPGFAAFLRCWPNPLHHSMAILAGDNNHLNHVNFMVTDIDDVGRAMNRMKKEDVKIVFGPGRHQPSESIFLYFLDPDDMTVEYSFGMECFPEDGAREPRLLEPHPEALDTWGSVPTPEFGKVGKIEAPETEDSSA